MSKERAGSRVLFQQELSHLLDIVGRDLDGAYRVLGIFAAYLAEVEVETDMRMRTARMLDVVDVERLIVSEHIGGADAIPRLPPDKVAVLLLGEPLLPRVMYPLDHRAGRARSLQKIGYGATVAEWIDGPARFGNHVEIRLEPLMT